MMTWPTLLPLAGLLMTILSGRAFAQTADDNKLTAGNTQFATDLYGKLAGQQLSLQDNLFFSPYSISSALAMTSAGAKGETQTQMDKTLHLDLDPAKMPPAFASLTGQLNKDGQFHAGGPDSPPAFELVVANALWGQTRYPFRTTYQDLLKDNFGAKTQNLDFAQPEPARAIINLWVATQTKDKIQDLIPPNAITPDTRMVLTNAIYFKANWAEKFEKTATTDQPFHFQDLSDAVVNVPMMRQVRSFGYTETPDLQAVELPYLMNRLSMVIIVPKKVDGLAGVEKDLSANLPQWLDGLKSRRVDVSLPRFKMTCSFSLADQLKALGMADAFDPAKADFSGMTTAEKLAISDVIHKAYVDVNEEGTEAAAATAVMMVGSAAMPQRDPPAVVKADRPFLFLIRHNGTGTILFVGRLARPESGSPGGHQ